MTQRIKHLAKITGFRDRDQLDAAVVRAVDDVLRPLSAGVYRCVGDTGNQRLLTRARLALNDPAATADPPWTDILTLPELDSVPTRREALATSEVVTSGHAPQTHHFPIAMEREVVGVLDVHTAGRLTPEDRATGRWWRPSFASTATFTACSITANATRSPACSTARPSTRP